MAQVHEADGFKVGDRVLYSSGIGGRGPMSELGTIDDMLEGLWGNYAKVIPDSGSYLFVTRRTDMLMHFRTGAL